MKNRMISEWLHTTSTDIDGRKLADRHYNRQNIGSKRFVPPGRCFVLITRNLKAVWVTSWPYAEYVLHEWAGAWVNTLFRNEGGGLSSELIKDAVIKTRQHWKEVPDLGLVTMVDTYRVRKKQNPGYCYLKAGFQEFGYTQSGKLVLGMSKEMILGL